MKNCANFISNEVQSAVRFPFLAEGLNKMLKNVLLSRARNYQNSFNIVFIQIAYSMMASSYMLKYPHSDAQFCGGGRWNQGGRKYNLLDSQCWAVPSPHSPKIEFVDINFSLET